MVHLVVHRIVSYHIAVSIAVEKSQPNKTPSNRHCYIHVYSIKPDNKRKSFQGRMYGLGKEVYQGVRDMEVPQWDPGASRGIAPVDLGDNVPRISSANYTI